MLDTLTWLWGFSLNSYTYSTAVGGFKPGDIMTNYDLCFVFKKFGGNLLEYYEHSDREFRSYQREYYSRLRDIRLILLVRYERNGNGNKNVFCKIHCPINPLPVKGEFETPSLGTIRKFLREQGWEETEMIPAGLLR